MRRRLLLTFGLVFVLTRPLAAQVDRYGIGTLVSYEIDVYDISIDPNGTGTPLMTMTLPAAAPLCNLTPLAPPKTLTQVNPQAVYWNDPVNVGKICKVTALLLGTLPTLTGSTYILTVTAIDDLGRLGPKSTASLPFNNTAPLAVTGVVAR